VNVWKIVCATLVIFVAGIVTGVVLVRLGEREPRPWLRSPRMVNTQPGPGNPLPPHQINPDRPGGNSGGPNSAANRDREFVQLLERQIQITPEQRAQIVKILADGQDRIRDLRQNIEPEIRREMQKSREQIQALLTETQREQFRRLMPQRQPRRNDATNQPPTERRTRDRENRRMPPPDAGDEMHRPEPPPINEVPPLQP
jgi:Spy/CpxP family protein refolding chaperone